jgi:hypothetical protein
MNDWTLDEEFLALSYFAGARSRWAAVGLTLPDDLESDERTAGTCADYPEGMTPAEVWQECLEEARDVLAHVCDVMCPKDVER